MIAVDTNILVHAHREDSVFHGRADERMAQLAEGRAPWAIPWPCLHEFLSIVTHPRIYHPPSTLEEGVGQIEAWFEAPTLVLLTEVPDYWPQFKKLAAAGQIAGPRVHDARVATLCLLHGVRELWTADRDFGRFSGLKTRNPLVD